MKEIYNLGHSNWTIWSPSSWFCTKIEFSHHNLVKMRMVGCRKEWMKIRNGSSWKGDNMKGFNLGHSIWTTFSPSSWFYFKISFFYSVKTRTEGHSWLSSLVYLLKAQSRGLNKLIECYYMKGSSSKRDDIKMLSKLEVFKLDHLQNVKLTLFQNFTSFTQFTDKMRMGWCNTEWKSEKGTFQMEVIWKYFKNVEIQIGPSGDFVPKISIFLSI